MPTMTHPDENRRTLERMASMAGSTARIEPRPKAHNSELIHGHFSARKSPSGILIHTMDAYETRDCKSTVRLSPCLNFCVLLEGSIEFTLNEIEHRFTSTPSSSTAFIMNVMAPSDWSRSIKKDRFVKKVVVSLPYDWIKIRSYLGSSFSTRVKALTQKHNSVFNWQTNSKLTEIANNLLLLSASDDELALESKALEFISQCFNQTENTIKLMGNEHIFNSSAHRIQAYLESHVIINPNLLKPNLREVTQALGMSQSSLQRNFKQQFNQTIFDYVRIRKLENSRDYLHQKNTNIGEAAYRAGYKHATNFSTAFKLAFGFTPGAYLKQIAPSKNSTPNILQD